MSRQSKFRSRIRFAEDQADAGAAAELEARVAAVLKASPDASDLRRSIADAEQQTDVRHANGKQIPDDSLVEALEQQILSIKADIDERHWELARVQAEKLKLAHRNLVAEREPHLESEALAENALSKSVRPEQDTGSQLSLSDRLRRLFGQAGISANDNPGATESASPGARNKDDVLEPRQYSPDTVETVDRANRVVVERQDEDPVAEAEWLASIGRYDAAIERLDRARKRSPGRAAFIDALREVYVLSREFDLSEQLSEAPKNNSEKRFSSSTSVQQTLYDIEATPLELVQAYLELDDRPAATSLLENIQQQGTDTERAAASEILKSLTADSDSRI